MNCLPLILRELRVGSRRWTTYWLRVLAAAAVIGGVLFWFSLRSSSSRAGSEMFSIMHRIVLAAVWVLVPLMTCDCLSQEKREGTLGLLFLTNLRSAEIVLAKAVAHGLRALTLWLAIIPIIAVPLLMGGLSWKEVALSCGVTFASLCVAVTTGLMASAFARRFNGAVALTAILTLVAHLFLLIIVSVLVGVSLVAGNMISRQDFLQEFQSEVLNIGLAVLWNANGDWVHFFASANTVAPWASWAVMGLVCLAPLGLLLLIAVCVLIIAPMIRRNWQDKPKTKQQQDVENVFCEPIVAKGVFKRWMRRSLNRNPIGWLEQRNWQGRITAWIWLAVMVSFTTVLSYEASHNYRGYIEGFDVLMWLLLSTIAYVAAASFRRERETGALELILVTPLSEWQIISGRLRGLWFQFLPTFVLWVIVVLYMSGALRRWHPSQLLFWSISYLIVPVVGLYFSLRSRFVLLSWLATLTACFALPHFLWQAWRFLSVSAVSNPFGSLHWAPSLRVTIAAQLAIAAFLFWRLHSNLRRRAFSLR